MRRGAVYEWVWFPPGFAPELQTADWIATHGRVNPPNYLYDLNAMYEAEKILTEEQLRDYWNYLWVVVKPKTAIHLLCYATAAQRAEAFLRTLNLWED